MGRKFTDEGGQAIVEFALVLPLLLLVLCMIIELSWGCLGKLAVSDMAREGARAGSVCAADNATQAAEDRALAVAPDYVAAASQIIVSFSNAASPRQGDISVQVSAQIEPLTPLLGIIGQESLDVSSQCTMKMN